MVTTPAERITALLTKNRANGATEEEETAAVDRALGLIRKERLQAADFEFPAGYSPLGIKIPPEGFDKNGRPEIIKQTCERLLMEVTGRDNDGFTTGHSYEEILRRVKAIHPHGQTSIKCLRWYATHMKEQDCKMPQKRDRPTPKQRAPKAPPANDDSAQAEQAAPAEAPAAAEAA